MNIEQTKQIEQVEQIDNDKEINFMGMENFKLSALKKLYTVWSSGIIGEPQYYSTNNIFMSSLKDALDNHYQDVLEFTIKLRNEYLMRNGPQIILVEAALHKNRQEFNKLNPNFFRNIAKQIILIPTDLKIQLDHYLKINNNKINNLPNILKRCWKDALEKFSNYQYAKYGNLANMINLIRISHPKSNSNSSIKELLENGKINVVDNESTWEKMHSCGKSWLTIYNTLGKSFPHMALLRNLRNLFSDNEFTNDLLTNVMQQLINGVPNGKQFPFRYYTAYKEIEQLNDVNNRKKIVLDGLENCMKKAIENFPSLEGKIVSLCDNSGSAHGAFTSQFGSQTVSTIGNLSALITAMSATDGGYVGIFGDRLHMYKVNKNLGIIEQLNEIQKIGKTVGQCTENGIWLYFKHAFDEFNKKINNFEYDDKYECDNLFIYSDMQAGHGGLYGSDYNDYKDFNCKGHYIDIIKLITRHRYIINNKLNVFTVQIAGYNNSIIPELLDRTCILAGWTGNEVKYAQELINLWNC